MSVAKEEVFISVDVESSGPIPGEYSLLSIGACLIEDPSARFYVEIQPISSNAVPEALRVTGFSVEKLMREGKAPNVAMLEFAEWIDSGCRGRQPVFVGFNACFDWSFINWYFHRFVGKNPFGIGGVDIKAYYMGRVGCPWSETTSSRLPAVLKPDAPHTHNALDDALTQAEIFRRLLEYRPS